MSCAGMKPVALRFALAWLGLLALLGVELGAALLLPATAGGALVLLAMAAMLAVVMLLFMRLRRSSGLAQAFAVAGLLWLAILLGLGSVDPLSRQDTPTAPQPGPPGR